MARKGIKRRTYSLETKLKVIMAYQSGMNYRTILTKFQMRHHDQIYSWHQWFKNNEWERLQPQEKRIVKLKPEYEQLKTKFLKEIKILIPFQNRKEKRTFYLHLIRKYLPFLSLNKITQWLRISKNTYYRWLKQEEEEGKVKNYLERAILKICLRHQYQNQEGKNFFIWGHRRVYLELLSQKRKVNIKTVYRKMKKLGLLCQTIKNRYLKPRKKTYVPCSGINLLKNNFRASQPLQKICADFTSFVYGKEQKLYLSAIMDLYNREIIAYHISDRIDAPTISIPFHKLPPLKESCLFHSDQGSQYTEQLFQKTLKEKKFIQSFSEKGQPSQNACLEAFFSNLKSETFHLEKKKSLTKDYLSQIIHSFIKNYNQKRRLKYLKYFTPLEFKNHYSVLNSH
ncbi:MAG: IS3 family transposase [Candidatus Phytoplasma stylosanthis]|nr:IS3 family transposase [Candidatus Phytoplasma stylosanthis]